MIRPFHDDDFEAVRGLLLADGWGRRANSEDRLRLIIRSATRAVVAEIEGRVVGFGRCVTDDVSNGYLSMVVVDSDHRRRGIGTAIVETLMGSSDDLTWMLRAGHPGSEAFWAGVGFDRSTIAFERPRRH